MHSKTHGFFLAPLVGFYLVALTMMACVNATAPEEDTGAGGQSSGEGSAEGDPETSGDGESGPDADLDGKAGGDGEPGDDGDSGSIADMGADSGGDGEDETGGDGEAQTGGDGAPGGGVDAEDEMGADCQDGDCAPEVLAGCEAVDCAEGLECALVEVTCVQEPCPAQPMCLAVETRPGDCDLVLCEAGNYCDDITGEAVCLPLPSCDLIDCAEDERCQLVDVTCVREPCPAQPQCVASDPGPSGCALVLCEAGNYCDDSSGEAVCLPVDEKPRDCSVVRCRGGQYCDDTSGEAVCLDLPTCEDVKCEEGTECVLSDVLCVRAPCPPQPECVAVGTQGGEVCGESICGDRQVCCNSSCGICTEPRGFCTQQVCPAPGGLTCATTLCVEGLRCVDSDAGPRCVSESPCDSVRCGQGSHCEVREVLCVTTPCDPVAECVADDERRDGLSG